MSVRGVGVSVRASVRVSVRTSVRVSVRMSVGDDQSDINPGAETPPATPIALTPSDLLRRRSPTCWRACASYGSQAGASTSVSRIFSMTSTTA